METSHVFIVGCPRTGTKLVRSILHRSGRIYTAPETHWLNRVRYTKGNRSSYDDRILTEQTVEQIIERVYDRPKISAYWQWLKKRLDRDVFRQRLLATDRSEKAIFSLLMQIYIEETLDEVPPDLIIGEKTPAHIDYVPTLLEWYPQAKVIHTFRDPRAITASRIKKVRDREISLDLGLPVLPKRFQATLDGVVEVIHISQIWLRAVRLHYKYEADYPDRYHLIKFEDLVYDPEAEIQKICAFLGIPFSNSMISEVVVVGSSYKNQQTGASGFDKTALERWREHLSPFAKFWFSITARKELQKFDYHI